MNNEISENLPQKNRLDAYKSLDKQKIDLSILLELGSIGASHAAKSLSDVLQQPITIDVPQIHTLKPHLIPKFYNLHELPTAAIYLQLTGMYSGDMLLMFEPIEGKKIAAMMSMVSSIEELDPTMEISALQELANILIGSFLTSISDLIGIVLLPTTPETVIDTFDAIIDNFLIKQSMTSDSAMVFEIRFKRNGGDANSILMIFPSEELKDLLIKSKDLIEA